MTSTPGPAAVADLEMQALDQRLSNQGEQPVQASVGVGTKFRYGRDFGDIPLGWASLSAQQDHYLNGAIHRRHGCLYQRGLFYLDGRLTWLEKLLMDRDKRDSQKGLRSLSAAQKRDVPEGDLGVLEAQEVQDGDNCVEKDSLIEEIITVSMRYAKLMLYDVQLRKLPRISRAEHSNLWDHVCNNDLLDEEARLILCYPDDCVTTMTDRRHNRFEWLLYGKRWNNFLVELKKKRATKGEYATVISTVALRLSLNIFIVSLSGMLLLLPVLILYLGSLTKAESAAVVVLFLVLFTICMMLLPEIKMDTVFVALCAYMAVLVTFLANFQSASQ